MPFFEYLLLQTPNNFQKSAAVVLSKKEQGLTYTRTTTMVIGTDWDDVMDMAVNLDDFKDGPNSHQLSEFKRLIKDQTATMRPSSPPEGFRGIFGGWGITKTFPHQGDPLTDVFKGFYLVGQRRTYFHVFLNEDLHKKDPDIYAITATTDTERRWSPAAIFAGAGLVIGLLSRHVDNSPIQMGRSVNLLLSLFPRHLGIPFIMTLVLPLAKLSRQRFLMPSGDASRSAIGDWACHELNKRRRAND